MRAVFHHLSLGAAAERLEVNICLSPAWPCVLLPMCSGKPALHRSKQREQGLNAGSSSDVAVRHSGCLFDFCQMKCHEVV